MTIRVDPPALRAAAGAMRGHVGGLEGVATSVGALSGIANPSLADAVESYGIAYEAALTVLADDVEYVAGRADLAANEFERTDGRMADLAEDPRAIQPE